MAKTMGSRRMLSKMGMLKSPLSTSASLKEKRWIKTYDGIDFMLNLSE